MARKRDRTADPSPPGQPAGGEGSGPSRREVEQFLKAVEEAAPVPVAAARHTLARRPAATAEAPAKLLFALDATMSRQPTWDLAVSIQAEMFLEAARFGGLAIKLVYFRGLRECRATGFLTDPVRLAQLMTRIDCRAGRTQMARVLRHAVKTARRDGLQAMVYVGDCCEEDPDRLAALAGELALLNVPCFFFHEGGDVFARRVFAELARITGGAALSFDAQSPQELSALLRGVAAYAAGGEEALRRLAERNAPARALLADLSGGRRRP